MAGISIRTFNEDISVSDCARCGEAYGSPQVCQGRPEVADREPRDAEGQDQKHCR